MFSAGPNSLVSRRDIRRPQRLVFKLILAAVLAISAAGDLEAKTIRLRKDKLLPYCQNQTLVFKGGTNVRMSAEGHVLSGTLAQDALLNFGNGTVIFRAGSTIVFRSSAPRCVVKTGTLAKDALLWAKGPRKSVNAQYRAGTTVTFNAKGVVINPPPR